ANQTLTNTGDVAATTLPGAGAVQAAKPSTSAAPPTAASADAASAATAAPRPSAALVEPAAPPVRRTTTRAPAARAPEVTYPSTFGAVPVRPAARSAGEPATHERAPLPPQRLPGIGVLAAFAGAASGGLLL